MMKPSEAIFLEYLIGELSANTGVPASTIREYEARGCISPSRRLKNGYRVYAPMHEPQLRLVRLCFCCFANRRLRQETQKIIACSASLDIPALPAAIDGYIAAIDDELQLAYDAANSLRDFKRKRLPEEPEYTRGQAASIARVSVDAVRGWERNGLIGTGAGCYVRVRLSQEDVERMKLIRFLLNTGYNLTAIRAGLGVRDPDRSYALLIAPEIRTEWLQSRDKWVKLLQQVRKNACKMYAEAEILSNLATAHHI